MVADGSGGCVVAGGKCYGMVVGYGSRWLSLSLSLSLSPSLYLTLSKQGFMGCLAINKIKIKFEQIYKGGKVKSRRLLTVFTRHPWQGRSVSFPKSAGASCLYQKPQGMVVKFNFCFLFVEVILIGPNSFFLFLFFYFGKSH